MRELHRFEYAVVSGALFDNVNTSTVATVAASAAAASAIMFAPPVVGSLAAGAVAGSYALSMFGNQFSNIGAGVGLASGATSYIMMGIPAAAGVNVAPALLAGAAITGMVGMNVVGAIWG